MPIVGTMSKSKEWKTSIFSLTGVSTGSYIIFVSTQVSTERNNNVIIAKLMPKDGVNQKPII